MSKHRPLEFKPDVQTLASIKVIGVGGSGGSAVNRMVSAGIPGVDFVAVNTDAQALQHSAATRKVHIGPMTTRGLGAGMDPELGARAAEESQEELRAELQGTDLVFITCGLGGGTGTGASPVVADLAREAGALTVAVVTKPFSFEGAQRRRVAEEGLAQLAERVDTIITIPNDRLLQVTDNKTPLLQAFAVVDDVLRQGVQGISEVVTVPGLINVDFADLRAIMHRSELGGSALMGIGRAGGEHRAVDAARAAIESPLLDVSIQGARGILFTISGGSSLTMHEVNEAASLITEAADQDAKIIFGAVLDPSLGEELKITVIATGFGSRSRDDGQRPSRPVAAPRPMGRPVPIPAAAPTASGNGWSRKTLDEVARPPANGQKGSADLNPLPPKTKEEEDLDIPAFIRKKMG